MLHSTQVVCSGYTQISSEIKYSAYSSSYYTFLREKRFLRETWLPSLALECTEYHRCLLTNAPMNRIFAWEDDFFRILEDHNRTICIPSCLVPVELGESRFQLNLHKSFIKFNAFIYKCCYCLCHIIITSSHARTKGTWKKENRRGIRDTVQSLKVVYICVQYF